MVLATPLGNAPFTLSLKLHFYTLRETKFCLLIYLFKVRQSAFASACIHDAIIQKRPRSLRGLPLGMVRDLFEARRAGGGSRASTNHAVLVETFVKAGPF